MIPEVKSKPGEFWQAAYQLFLDRIAPYELAESKRTFLRLVDLADVANPQLAADPGVWYEAVYAQLKCHLLDTPPIFTWVPGKVPEKVLGHQKQLAAQNTRSSGSAADQAEAESIGQDYAQQQQREREREQFKEACEVAVASFYPIKYGRLSYAIQSEVQGILTKYLQEQIARGEPNMADVHRKIVAYIDNEYKKLAPSEKLSPTTTHVPSERR